MRFAAVPRKTCLAVLTAVFTGCATPAQLSIPVSSQDAKLKTVFVSPVLVDGGFRAQAIVNPKRAQDIAALEVVPYVHVGDEDFWPIDALTGEATDSIDPQAIVMARKEGYNAERPTVIPLTGLRPDARYRIVARAFDASDALISTDDERSWTEFSLDEAHPPAALSIPLTLIDTPFGTSRSFTLTITGGDFTYISGTLYKVKNDLDEPVPGGTLNLTLENADKRITINHLEAETTYRLDLRAQDHAALPIATKSIDWIITNDDEHVHEDLIWEIPEAPPAPGPPAP